jgi:exodeoxyribonuclease VII large subunit
MPRPDVLIVARGGGSLDDLWSFNDEIVVRAAAASKIPLISAVGHETDWTLIDHASDRRAPTPTGAAEMAVPVRADLEATVARLSARLKSCATRGMDRRRQAFRALARALPSPDQILALPRRRFDEAGGRLSRALDTCTHRKRLELSGVRLTAATLTRRLAEARRRGDQCGGRLPVVFQNRVAHARNRFARDAARITPSRLLGRMTGFRDRLDAATRSTDRCIEVRLEQRRTRLDHACRLVESLSYKAILERGFALVRDGGDKPLKRAAEVKPGSALSI